MIFSSPNAWSSIRSSDWYCTCCSMPVCDEIAYRNMLGRRSRRSDSSLTPWSLSLKGTSAAAANAAAARPSITRWYSAALEATSERRMTPLDDDPKDRSVGVRELQHFSPKLIRRQTRQLCRAKIDSCSPRCLFTENILAVNHNEEHELLFLV